MSLDVGTISAVKDELCERLISAKIDKIQQPQRDMIILTTRSRAGDVSKLLISVCMQDMRVHLTQHTFENPDTPPMFCMLLRKYLTGARIEEILQPPNERLLEFVLKASTAMGDPSSRHLIIELFGRIPNIILTDSDRIIIDCLRRVGGDADGRRMILPGLRYAAPESNPLLCRENPAQKLQNGSISQILDATFTQRSKTDNMRVRAATLIKTVKTTQKRLSRKLAAQKTELEQTAKREYYKECGDIIMANMHLIKKGDGVLIADDFYSDIAGAKREIPLDPLKTPQKNAAKYYKDYTKARNAKRHLTEQIKSGECELEYIESVLEQLARAENEQDLDDIRDELMQSNYLKLLSRNTKNVKKIRKIESKPIQIKSSSGVQILIGRNNTQNDKLTFKTASRFDTWLHAQKIHGAHVIIKSNGQAVDEATLLEAAGAAAFYSAARNAGKVPVDYTLVKYVKKPSGAKPGMVIYSEFKTVYVKPEVKC